MGRWLELALSGAAPALVLGWVMRGLWNSPGKKACRYSTEYTNSWNKRAFTLCPATTSPTCVEHLCPKHCNQLHRDRCFNLTFQKESQ